jgi:hypothetical protein
MKKWLIFAVIAAMFAMVMFPACGNKSGESDGAAGMPDVVQVLNAAGDTLLAVIVRWEGTAGYDYYVYFEERDIYGTVMPLAGNTVYAVKGQTTYGLIANIDSNDDGDPDTPFWQIDVGSAEKTSWSIAISADDCYYGNMDTTTITPALKTAFGTVKIEVQKGLSDPPVDRAKWYRVGVVAGNPGGYPIEEKRAIVYSDWF